MRTRSLALIAAVVLALASSVTLAQDARVTGVVEDARGKPVAGASVEVLRPKRPGRPLDHIAMLRDLASVWPSVAAARSSADGRFETTVLPPGTYPVVARKAGHVAAAGSVTVGDGAPVPMTLSLGAGHRVEGTVVRKDGSPASGVSVIAFSGRHGLDFDPPDKPIARADAKGRFVFEALPAGSWRFVAAPPNEGYSHVAEARAPLTEPLALTLDGTSTLTGQVTDEAGTPVAGARVVVGFARGFGIDLEYGSTTTTDAEGRYEMRGLSTASAGLFFVQADGYCPHRGRVHQGDEPRRQDVRLALGGTIRGVVVAQGTKSAVPNATITVLSADTMIGGAGVATAGADGEFELRGVPLGRSMLLVTKAGWRQAGVPDPWALRPDRGAAERETPDAADPGAGAIVVVSRSGEVVERTIDLFRPARIRGTVIGPDGRPFAGARLAAVREGEEADRRSDLQLFLTTGEKRPVTDASGRFDIESPVLDGRVVVEANAAVPDETSPMERRMRSSVVVSVDPEKPPPPVDIRLGSGTSIAGRMTDATTGEPVGDVWVGWWNDEKGTAQLDLQEDMGFASSAPDGSYRFDVVTSGSVRMETRSTLDRKYVWASRVVTVEAGEVNTVDWALERAKSISGRVVFTDGRAAAGAWIEVAELDREDEAPRRDGSESAQADDSGAFTAKGLPSGRYRLVAHAGDDRAESEPVIASAGAADVELRIPASVAIAGVVRFGDGSPAVGLTVSPWPADEARQRRGFRMRSAITAADGSFRFDDLLSGTYNLVVDADRAPGVNIRPKRLHGIAAGTTNLVIELERGLKLAGWVLGPDGARVAQARVHCVPVMVPGEEYEPLDIAVADVTAGRFELAGLAPREHVLVVSAPGLASTKLTVTPGPDEVEVRLPKAARVKGRVYFPDGTPAGRASVWIRDSESEGSTSARCFAAADGTFELDDVGPGTHRVRATEDPVAAQEESREPRAGDVAGVRVAEGGSVEGVEIRLKPAAPK